MWLTLNNTQHLVTLNPSHLLFWVNLVLNPSKFTFMTIILHLIAHLKMWINHVVSVTPPAPTDSLDESSTLSAQDDHLWQLDSTSLTSQLQDTSSIEIEFVPELEGQLDHGNPSQTDFFLNTMTMNCSY